MKIWINGKVVSEKKARVSVYDRGFLYGDGVFETMRSYDGALFKIDGHLNRLYKSLGVIKIKIPYSKTLLKKKIYKLLKMNMLKDAYIRIVVTRGTGTVGFTNVDTKKPTVVIIVKKFTPYPKGMYKKGVRVKIVKVRQNENSPVSKIKSISFLNYILARLEAKEGGFDDAIMLNSRGRVAEAAVSNIFLVKGGQLITPSLGSGPLPGITRKIVINLAARAGLKAKEVEVTAEMLYNADEVFLTNSLMEVMPVIKIGNKVIGNGKPGECAGKIREAYQALYT